MSERDFRAAYSSISAYGKDGIGAPNPSDVRFLPLLFVVLAIAVRLAPEHLAGDARTRRVTSLRYYWSCEHNVSFCFDCPTHSTHFLSPTVVVDSSGCSTRLARYRLDAFAGQLILPSGVCLSQSDSISECQIPHVRSTYNGVLEPIGRRRQNSAGVGSSSRRYHFG